jgi:hypothetical protein
LIKEGDDTMGILIGSFYIILLSILVVANVHIPIINSSKIIPDYSRWISKTRITNHFIYYLQTLLKFWKLSFLFRHLTLGISVLMFGSYMYIRLESNQWYDLIWISLAFLIATFVHELGHAVIYSNKKYLVIDFQIWFPLSGKTTAYKTDNSHQRLVGIAGGGANLLFCIVLVLFLPIVQYPFSVYSILINLGYYATTYFPRTKDYEDIVTG